MMRLDQAHGLESKMVLLTLDDVSKHRCHPVPCSYILLPPMRAKSRIPASVLPSPNPLSSICCEHNAELTTMNIFVCGCVFVCVWVWCVCTQVCVRYVDVCMMLWCVCVLDVCACLYVCNMCLYVCMCIRECMGVQVCICVMCVYMCTCVHVCGYTCVSCGSLECRCLVTC